jgi:hypothetical protein
MYYTYMRLDVSNTSTHTVTRCTIPLRVRWLASTKLHPSRLRRALVKGDDAGFNREELVPKGAHGQLGSHSRQPAGPSIGTAEAGTQTAKTY